MNLSVRINNQSFGVDLENPLDISIPLDFGGPQPNAYGAERARAKACEGGSLVGDTRRGGSCNFEQVTLIPHCNGTHTESVGHLTHERISVSDCHRDAFTLAALVSAEPEQSIATDESYAAPLAESDRLITRRAIERALERICSNDPGVQISDFKSLVVRTLPNDEDKKDRVYLEDVPPFFSTEAMNLMVELGVRHLLVDTPSIDRLFDEGRLSNHRIFWQVEQGKFEVNENSLVSHTITELIYVPGEIADGIYLLNLQIAPFASDAAPSRPVLFECLATERR